MHKNLAAFLATSLLGLSASNPSWAGAEGTWSTFYGQFTGLPADATRNTFIGAATGHDATSGTYNSFLGYYAGEANTSGSANTFLGAEAGQSNTSGFDNTVVGRGAGIANTGGNDNVYVGTSAGSSSVLGAGNTIVGSEAGVHTIGSYNVFLGFGAGNLETGSGKLYINNCNCDPPFIYGDFFDYLLKINAVLNVRANGVAKSQMHFSQNDTDTGGFLTSVLDNNFFVSSGARYDGTAGGWIQRSPDNNAVIAGSGGVGYRIFTSSGHAVGTNFTPTVRLHIDYSGQFGINTAPVAGHEIHTATGAYEAGGTWVNGSSRELKDDIVRLSSEEATQALAALDPIKFRYKSDRQWQHVGFIAEDVPQLVASPDRKGLSPMDIVAVLTKVVQEQKQTVESLTATVSKLQKQVQALQSTR